ncbi:hypothetical protein AtubIFM57143_007918 [Aspergillus tubingensis]|nr:hypothetical protein AtubIFM57143_007918 [Aspergillus tubingensis]
MLSTIGYDYREYKINSCPLVGRTKKTNYPDHELKVTKGSENTLNASMGMLFEGLSVGIDASSKTFQQTETTTSETHTVELAYGPGADDRSPLSKGLLVQDEYLVHE